MDHLGLSKEPTVPLLLIRFKQHWQETHGIGIRPHHTVACSAVAHDVLATTWVELFQTQSEQYACQLYALWYKDAPNLDAAIPLLLYDQAITLTDMSAELALPHLVNRFDRIIIEKDRVLLRDRDAITDPRNLVNFLFWKTFTPSDALAAGVLLIAHACYIT